MTVLLYDVTKLEDAGQEINDEEGPGGIKVHRGMGKRYSLKATVTPVPRGVNFSGILYIEG